MTMKRILTMLMMLACIVLVPSCKSGKNKSGEKVQNGEKTLTELVQDVDEAPKMGIWKVKNLHNTSYPTIDTETIKAKDSNQICRFITIFPNTIEFLVEVVGNFPPMSEDEDKSFEVHWKSDNQKELVVYGGTDYRRDHALFDKNTSKQIIRYMSEATSPVTLTFVGVPKNMTFEIPTEGFKEVCKCWFNSLKEKGYDQCLK